MPIAPVCIMTGEIEAFGGAERSILALCRFLHDIGIEPTVLTYQDRVDLGQYADYALDVYVLRPSGGIRGKISALRSFFSQHPCVLLASGYQAALHATLAGQRGFHTLMHDTPSLFHDALSQSWKDRLRTSVSNLVLQRGLNSGGVTIVTSAFLKQECWRDFHVRAQIARMGGLQAMPFRERPALDGTLNLLSVSRLESNKRLDWVVDALASLERRASPLSLTANWTLRIAGKGSQLKALQERVRSTSLEQRVHFLGFVPDTELAALFDQAHLFVMPAVQGYGIPAVEALQAGIPVLLHRDSGVSDILLNTPWATVVEGGPQQMTAALEAAIQKVLQGKHVGTPLPDLDTEQSWAQRVAQLCGWFEPPPSSKNT